MDDTDVPSLSNQDFRSLVEAQRKIAQDSAAQAAVDHLTAEEKRAAKSTKKKQRSEWYKKQLEKKAKKEAETNKYRNRAKERQLDINPDYQDLQSYENVDAEKSKYLGGEISRTHLVKGLDEVLLKKVKEEQERDIDEKLDREYTKTSERKPEVKFTLEKDAKSKVAPKVELNCALARNLYAVVTSSFATPLALYSAVADAASSSTFVSVPLASALPAIAPVHHFLPGRMSFEFDLDPNFSKELPTTVIHSIEEAPTSQSKVSGYVLPELRERLSKILNFGTKMKRKPKKEDVREEGKSVSFSDAIPSSHRSGKVAVPSGAADEIDIFAGAGKYVSPSPVSSSSAASSSSSSSLVAPSSSYFSKSPFALAAPSASSSALSSTGSKSAASTAPSAYSAVAAAASSRESGGSAPDGPNASRLSRMAPIANVNITRKRISDSGAEIVVAEEGFDEYAECYPAFHQSDVAGTVYDSDEEDLSHMDHGAENVQKKRWDFDSEEAWSEYNQKRETLPKAAFQFGQKVTDGRVSKKHQLKSSSARSEDAKLDKQLKQIQQIMTQKKPTSAAGDSDAAMSKRQKILSLQRM